MIVNVHEAKTNLSRLLKQVAAGGQVTIARDGTPVAHLVPATPVESFPLGFERGRIKIADNFDDPLPPDVLALFNGPEKKKRKARR